MKIKIEKRYMRKKKKNKKKKLKKNNYNLIFE